MRDPQIYNEFAAALRAREAKPPAFLNEGASELVSAGLAVYRNNVRSSLSKALAETFPVTAQLVGDDFFKFAAGEYFDAHPPSSPVIVQYGVGFPAFLESFTPAKTVPYLADVARLEIAWLDAYRASDTAPLPMEHILAVAGDDPSQLCFTLHPSLRLIKSGHPIASIWRRHQDDAADVCIKEAAGEWVMIVRPHLDVIVHDISHGLYIAIQNLSGGGTVEQAFEHALSADQNFDPQDAFGKIFNAEIVTGIAGDHTREPHS
jgi:putative DNA-binding protein